MTITRLLLIGALAGTVLWGANRHFDPYSAKLPLDSTDLSGIQDKLAQLPAEEQALVKAYVERTGGRSGSDSLLVSAQLDAMPNLKEAITRQRTWLDKEAKLNATVDAEFAGYNAKFDAMRKVLQIELVGTSASRDYPHTFSFKNKSPQTIVAFEARVLVRPAHLKLADGGGPYNKVAAFAYPFAPGKTVLLPAGYTRPTLIPFASVDIRAAPLVVGKMLLQGTEHSELILETYPTYIRFANGQELKIPDEILRKAPDAGAVFGHLLKE